MTAHTKHGFCIFLLGLSLLWACKSQETLPADQVAMKPNESVSLGNLTIRIDTLRQAGCARCLFAYNAFISAIISNKTDQQRVRLSLYGPIMSRQDSAGVTFAGQTYKVILRDVTPHPDSDYGYTRPVDNKVILQVTKL